MEQEKRKKIAIIGKATSSRHLAPYDDPSWQIWVLSDNYKHCPRWDKWYELHSIQEGQQRWQPGYWPKMLEHQDRLVIQAPHPDLPRATVYPLQEVLSRFGDYLNNSVSFMVAAALLEGVHELGLWGVDMACSDPARGNNGEYEHQRPSCEFFLGIAHGMGVHLHIPAQSDLLRAGRLYAFESHRGSNYLKYQARCQELRERASAAQSLARQKEQEAIACGAALENMKYFYRDLGDSDHQPWEMRREIQRLQGEVMMRDREIERLKNPPVAVPADAIANETQAEWQAEHKSEEVNAG